MNETNASRTPKSRWIGVDLDGTLAEYHGWEGVFKIGEPIPLMVDRVKQWLAIGMEVRIFTARVGAGSPALVVGVARMVIRNWCMKHLGQRLPITDSISTAQQRDRNRASRQS